MNLTIRDFTPDDREIFLGMCADFYSGDAVTAPVPAKNFQRTFDICLKGSPYVQGILFWVNDKPAGYALLSFTYSNEVGGLSVLLEEAYILPAFQRKGIAQRFFKIVEEQYVVAGKAKRLRLEVTPVNKGAISLYERLGYKSLNYVQMIKDFD